MGVAKPMLAQNWLTAEDIANLLGFCDFEMLRHWREALFPFNIPCVKTLCNSYLVKMWPFKHAAVTNFLIAKPRTLYEASEKKPTVSVIVPARNESGNIEEIFTRTPDMGGGTELVFVEGGSTDNTYETIEKNKRQISRTQNRFVPSNR